MKAFFRLYKNELKTNKVLAVLFFIAISGLRIFFETYSDSSASYKSDLITISMIFSIAFFLPLALFYSFTSEKNSETHYQLLSLPLKRSSLLLSRYAALISIMIVIIFLGRYFLELAGSYKYLRFSRFGFLNAIINMILYFFSINLFKDVGISLLYIIQTLLSPIFLIAGILCTADSLRYIIKRNKIAVEFIFLMFSYIMILWSTKFITLKSIGFTNRISENIIVALVKMTIISINVYFFLIGILFLIIGTVLFEKYADV